MSRFGLDVQWSPNTEIFIMGLAGMIITAFEDPFLTLSADIDATLTTQMSNELVATAWQGVTRLVMVGLILARSCTAHLSIITFILLLWPLFFNHAGALMLPWLVVAAVRNVLTELVALLIGSAMCVRYSQLNGTCVEFLLLKGTWLMPGLYMWISVLYLHNDYGIRAMAAQPLAMFAPMSARRKRVNLLADERVLRRRLWDEMSSRETNAKKPVWLVGKRCMRSVSMDNELNADLPDADVTQPSPLSYSRSLDTLRDHLTWDWDAISKVVQRRTEEEAKLSLDQKAKAFLGLSTHEVTYAVSEARVRKLQRMMDVATQTAPIDVATFVEGDASDGDDGTTTSTPRRLNIMERSYSTMSLNDKRVVIKPTMSYMVMPPKYGHRHQMTQVDLLTVEYVQQLSLLPDESAIVRRYSHSRSDSGTELISLSDDNFTLDMVMSLEFRHQLNRKLTPQTSRAGSVSDVSSRHTLTGYKLQADTRSVMDLVSQRPAHNVGLNTQSDHGLPESGSSGHMLHTQQTSPPKSVMNFESQPGKSSVQSREPRSARFTDMPPKSRSARFTDMPAQTSMVSLWSRDHAPTRTDLSEDLKVPEVTETLDPASSLPGTLQEDVEPPEQESVQQVVETRHSVSVQASLDQSQTLQMTSTSCERVHVTSESCEPMTRSVGVQASLNPEQALVMLRRSHEYIVNFMAFDEDSEEEKKKKKPAAVRQKVLPTTDEEPEALPRSKSALFHASTRFCNEVYQMSVVDVPPLVLTEVHMDWTGEWRSGVSLATQSSLAQTQPPSVESLVYNLPMDADLRRQLNVDPVATFATPHEAPPDAHRLHALGLRHPGCPNETLQKIDKQVAVIKKKKAKELKQMREEKVAAQINETQAIFNETIREMEEEWINTFEEEMSEIERRGRPLSRAVSFNKWVSSHQLLEADEEERELASVSYIRLKGSPLDLEAGPSPSQADDGGSHSTPKFSYLYVPWKNKKKKVEKKKVEMKEVEEDEETQEEGERQEKKGKKKKKVGKKKEVEEDEDTLEEGEKEEKQGKKKKKVGKKKEVEEDEHATEEVEKEEKKGKKKKVSKKKEVGEDEDTLEEGGKEEKQGKKKWKKAIGKKGLKKALAKVEEDDKDMDGEDMAVAGPSKEDEGVKEEEKAEDDGEVAGPSNVKKNGTEKA